MKAVQMRAGNDPPVTEFIPPTPESETGLPFASSLTNITAAARSGVYPANHADLFSLVVPVLPAAGRPSASAATPVPSVTTLRSA